MNLGDWDDEDVADLWADKNTDGQGDCDACHNLGADGFMASNQSAQVFDYITRLPALMPSYFTVNADGTSVVINRARLENVGTLQEPHQAHGAFNVDGNAMEALQRFYDKTRARQLASENGGIPCGPPRYLGRKQSVYIRPELIAVLGVFVPAGIDVPSVHVRLSRMW